MFAVMAELFEGELNPVHASAIDHVPIPEGLNLDEWIHEPPPESSFEVNLFLFPNSTIPIVLLLDCKG
jgi:hypothetical protein